MSGTGLVASLLPAGVVGEEAESRPGDGVERELHPLEEAVVRQAVEKRRREFAAVRACARRALHRLGVPPVPILPGPGGAPQWPTGIIGSMSHCTGYVAAALARAGAVAAVGIDVELDGPLPRGIVGHIARPEERDRLHGLGVSHPDVHWDRLLFSIKESVYKAWYPLTGQWLGFSGATVWIEPDSGCFRAELLVPGPVVGGSVVQSFQGRWACAGGVVATAVLVPGPSFQ